MHAVHEKTYCNNLGPEFGGVPKHKLRKFRNFTVNISSLKRVSTNNI